MATILVGTPTGLCIVDPSGSTYTSALEGHEVRALAPESWKRTWAIVDAREVWRTEDGGSWRRVASLADVGGAEDLEAHCLADTRANQTGGILVGTSRARLLRITPELDLEPVSGFDAAPSREEWYTPWGAPADTRTITEDGAAVFVNVHVGGVLRSRDEGATWQPTIDIHADVHRVVTGGARVYAAGATGLSVSEDGGDSWRLATAGLHARYCRSVAVCGPTLLLSASDGPDGHRAALYRADLAAEGFERCRDGLPAWFDGNLDSLCVDALPAGELAAIGTQNGEVYASDDQGSSWIRVADGLGTVRCVLVVPTP